MASSNTFMRIIILFIVFQHHILSLVSIPLMVNSNRKIGKTRLPITWVNGTLDDQCALTGDCHCLVMDPTLPHSNI